MGGFGAVRYAQDRPDLFAYVGSFSGAVDLGDSGTRAVITEQAIQNGYSGNAAFGNPFWPFDATWNALNPLNRAGAAPGRGRRALRRRRQQRPGRPRGHDAGLGRPVPRRARTPPACRTSTGCTGGPARRRRSAATAATTSAAGTSRCNDALPRMLAVLQGPAHRRRRRRRRNPVVNGGFETPGLGPWACQGNCGADHGAGLARTGTGNGWVRNNTGWNDLHQTIAVAPNRTYAVTRVGADVGQQHRRLLRAAHHRRPGARRAAVRPARRLHQAHRQREHRRQHAALVLFAGLWANGDTWFQIDDVTVAP